MQELILDLENWFKERPLWLQDATKRLFEKGGLGKSDYDDLLKICLSEVGAEFNGQDVPKAKPIPVGCFSQEEHVNKVEICSISNVVGINALNPKKPLNFPEGLTVIYGKNGSGKSGYIRLLKQVCGAKNPGQLHPNTFEQEPASQSCKIAYKSEGDKCELSWDISQGINEQLSAIELYDSECGSVYVINENQLAYEPKLLRLFSELTLISDEVSKRLDGVSKLLISSKPLLPNEYVLTKSGKWYKSITQSTTNTTIDVECTWSELDQKSLEDYNLRLKSLDPKAQAKKIRNSKIQVNKLIAGFRNWESKLSNSSCATYLALKKDYSVKQTAASEYAKSIFNNSPLSGIGDETWALLWEKAREYSENVAYKKAKFPNISDGAVCVLCQQPLDAEAKQRLSDFENFVKGELELSAKKAKELLDKMELELKNTPNEELITTMIAASGLDENISVKLLTLREDIALKSTELLGTEIGEKYSAKLDFKVLKTLYTLSETMETNAEKYDEDAKKDNRAVICKEAIELEARKWISQQKIVIMNEVVLLGKKAKINKAKSLVNTASLTRKKSLLAEKLVTSEYILRFNNEIKKLGAGRINVNLEKTRSGKGGCIFKLN